MAISATMEKVWVLFLEEPTHAPIINIILFIIIG
jgi:hypothetical protein